MLPTGPARPAARAFPQYDFHLDLSSILPALQSQHWPWKGLVQHFPALKKKKKGKKGLGNLRG